MLVFFKNIYSHMPMRDKTGAILNAISPLNHKIKKNKKKEKVSRVIVLMVLKYFIVYFFSFLYCLKILFSYYIYIKANKVIDLNKQLYSYI